MTGKRPCMKDAPQSTAPPDQGSENSVQAAAHKILSEGNHFSWGVTPPLDAQ